MDLVPLESDWNLITSPDKFQHAPLLYLFNEVESIRRRLIISTQTNPPGGNGFYFIFCSIFIHKIFFFFDFMLFGFNLFCFVLFYFVLISFFYDGGLIFWTCFILFYSTQTGLGLDCQMYQSLVLPVNQSSFPHDSGTMAASAGSPVYLPPGRVPGVLPGLAYLQAGDSTQQHHGWHPGPADGPHPPPGFYQGRNQTFLDGSGSRVEQFGVAAVRSVGGAYASAPYAYLSPEMATSSWTPGPVDSSVISLQGPHGTRRRSSLGEQNRTRLVQGSG